MDAQQLSGRKQRAPSRPGWRREERVDQTIWNVGRERLQQRRSARGRESLHGLTGYPKKPAASVGNQPLHFFKETSSRKTTCSEFRNTLQRDSDL